VKLPIAHLATTNPKNQKQNYDYHKNIQSGYNPKKHNPRQSAGYRSARWSRTIPDSRSRNKQEENEIHCAHDSFFTTG
jgi:hypothetical protein